MSYLARSGWRQIEESVGYPPIVGYFLLSEGSRLWLPRNAIPVPSGIDLKRFLMQALTNEQARGWCERKAVSLSRDGYPYFDRHKPYSIAVDLPEKPYELVALTNAVLPYSESTPFQGALLWIRRFGVWGEVAERFGMRVVEAVRCMHGQRVTMDDAPASAFEEGELVDLHVSFLQPLLIGWDSFMIPDAADYVVSTTHDGLTYVLSRTAQTHGRILAELEAWHPREDPHTYFEGLDIPH